MYRIYFFFRRIIDFIMALIALILLIPLFLIIAIAIKIDSKGPVFFKQKRLTKKGKEFKMVKFRTMIPNAEFQGAGLFNYKNDPRVTKVGRFLRNSSLDELPQLINILTGKMAIVGPRPCVSYELGDYNQLSPEYKKRFEVLPGLTGLAQVKGRNDIAWPEKIKYDNQYIDNVRKFWFFTDIKIIFLTIIKVFKKESIYEVEDESLKGLSAEEKAKIEQEKIIQLAAMPKEDQNNE